MTGFSVLLLGVGLGLRHALDADHVVVVSTLLAQEPGRWRAARIAALWGLGHSLTFLGVGLLIVLLGVRVPHGLERAAELAVAAMLISVGAAHLLGALRSARAPRRVATARPVAFGLVHGLAGSAGVALLAATTLSSRWLAASYVCLVALGTVVGMIGLTLALARPIGWTARTEVARRVVGAAMGGLGVVLGLAIALEAARGAW